MTVETTVEMTVKREVETTDINRLRQDNKKKKKEEVKTFDELIETYTQDEDLRKELKNHLAIRKKRGNLTNRSLELGFENLDSLTRNIRDERERTKEKIEIVKKSIASGWPDYYPLKKENKTVSKNKHEEEIPEGLGNLYDN